MNIIQSSVAALVEAALAAAIRAPSPHNTQPWRFEVGPRHVDLVLDRERVLPIADPDAREARLSCGAALLNIRLALAVAGRMARVEPLPDHERPDLLAAVWVGARREPSSEQRALAAVIERRASNRRPFADRPVAPRQRHTLTRAAATEGARLILLERPDELSTFAALLRRADTLQAEDPAFQSELLQWVAEHDGREDGVPRAAGGPRPLTGDVLAMRGYPGHSASARPFEQDPLVAILATAGDTPLDQLRAGQAMQRVLLAATVEGLSVSFVSQPMEIASTRAGLRELTGGRSHPQTVLRIGHGYAVPQTPRRSVEQVTTVVEEREPRS